MKNMGFLFFATGLALIIFASSWSRSRDLARDEAVCRYNAQIMKLDVDKEKVAVAYCMQNKGWKP